MLSLCRCLYFCLSFRQTPFKLPEKINISHHESGWWEYPELRVVVYLTYFVLAQHKSKFRIYAVGLWGCSLLASRFGLFGLPLYTDSEMTFLYARI